MKNLSDKNMSWKNITWKIISGFILLFSLQAAPVHAQTFPANPSAFS